MGGGRKNLKRGTEEKSLSLEDGQCIVQVVSLRGSNLIEVMDAKGDASLAYFPAKFQKSMWIKHGSFVVVDESGKEKALGSGSKVGSKVLQVLFYEQVRTLQRSPDWPEVFRSKEPGSSEIPEIETAEQEEAKLESSDDGLPPLEANTNRNRPYDLHKRSGSNSHSDSDTDSDS